MRCMKADSARTKSQSCLAEVEPLCSQMRETRQEKQSLLHRHKAAVQTASLRYAVQEDKADVAARAAHGSSD
jgi:signal transduction histidine kinase